ncbi:MAG: (d)CMP kinase [Candidatus Zixiibacteriota bacterium]
MAEQKYHSAKLKGRIIAIDGPAGSGKSTTAKILAARLGYNYLDTGAMYRAVTQIALQNRIAPNDAPRLAAVAQKMKITFETHEDVNRVFVDGVEVTAAIRTPEVTRHVSEVSAHKAVREAMVARQMELGKNGSIVAEGRDTTTVVFPHADIKVYLDASVETRAERRMLDLARMGITTTLDEQIADLKRRDAFDSGREHSPLQKAGDAFTIDTTDMTIDEQVANIVALLERVLSRK